MKVVETSHTRLVIEDRPWFLWITLVGLGLPAIFAAVTGRVDGGWQTLLVGALGIGALWVCHYFEPFQRLTFDRAAGTLTHDLSRLTGKTRFERPLQGIKYAADEGHYSDGARLTRVTLITADGRHPLESGYSSRNIKPTIQAINDWLGPGD